MTQYFLRDLEDILQPIMRKNMNFSTWRVLNY